MAKQDFGVGLLQGLYNAGVGNPEVQREENQLKLANAFKQAQLQQEAAEKGLVPTQTASPDTFKKGSPVWALFKKALFPGYSDDFNIPSSFQPDPTQPQIYSSPTGEVGMTQPGQAIPQGAMRIPRNQGIAAMTASEGRKQRLSELEENRELRLSKYIDDKAEKIRNNYLVKGIMNQGLALDQVNELIKLTKAGNTVSSAALGIKIAKGLGEVGVMTEQDVVRYIQSKKLSQKVVDILSGTFIGKPSDVTLDEIKGVTDVIQYVQNTRLQPVFNDYVNTLSANFNMPKEEAARRLGVPYNPKVKGAMFKATETDIPVNAPAPTSSGETPEQRKQRLIQELQGAR